MYVQQLADGCTNRSSSQAPKTNETFDLVSGQSESQMEHSDVRVFSL